MFPASFLPLRPGKRRAGGIATSFTVLVIAVAAGLAAGRQSRARVAASNVIALSKYAVGR